MTEVEAQPVGRNERASLVNMLAEHGPKGRVEKVRRRVIPFGVEARVARNRRPGRAGRDRTVRLADDGGLSVDPAHLFDIESPPSSLYFPAIRNLTAGLDIKRGLAKHHRRPAFRERLKSKHFGVGLDSFVADKVWLFVRHPAHVGEIVARNPDAPGLPLALRL